MSHREERDFSRPCCRPYEARDAADEKQVPGLRSDMEWVQDGRASACPALTLTTSLNVEFGLSGCQL